MSDIDKQAREIKDILEEADPYSNGLYCCARALLKKGYHRQADGLILTIDGATGYFPKEFIIEAIQTHMKHSKKECPKCKYFLGCEKALWVRGCEEFKEVEDGG